MRLSKLIHLLNWGLCKTGDVDVLLYDREGKLLSVPALRGNFDDILMDPTTNKVTVKGLKSVVGKQAAAAKRKGEWLEDGQAKFIEASEAPAMWYVGK